MKIKTKIYLIFIVYLILLVILGNALIFTARQMVHSIDKSDLASDMVQGLFGLNVLTNDYILYQSERAKEQWQAVYTSLGNVIAHNLPHEKKVKHTHTHEEEAILHELHEDWTVVGELFPQITDPAISKELHDRLVSQILIKSQEMVTNAFELSQMSQRTILKAQGRDNIFNLVFLTSMFILVLVGFYSLIHSTLKPMEKLMEGTEIIGKGDLKYKIDIKGKDEIGNLAAAFNRMTTNLQETTASRDELDKEIAERKQAEIMITKQQEQLNSIFDGIDDVIYVADPDTYELLFTNDVAKKIWGDNIIGKKCYEILQGRNSPCPFCTNKEILKKLGEPVIWEFQNENNKRWYRCFDKAIQWSDGKMVRFELAMDITEMKEVQQQIIKEKAITESVLDSIPGIFYQIDTKGKFVRTNKSFQELVGKTENEMNTLNAVELFEGEDRQLIAEAMQKVFVDGHYSVEANMAIQDKKIPFYFTGILTKIDDIPYLIGMGTDVSTLKEIETNLRKTNSELEMFNKMAVGREKRMIELKRKINSMSKELGNEEPYDLSFAEADTAKETN